MLSQRFKAAFSLYRSELARGYIPDYHERFVFQFARSESWWYVTCRVCDYYGRSATFYANTHTLYNCIKRKSVTWVVCPNCSNYYLKCLDQCPTVFSLKNIIYSCNTK